MEIIGIAFDFILLEFYIFGSRLPLLAITYRYPLLLSLRYTTSNT